MSGNGGAAFPRPMTVEPNGTPDWGSEGMSLRSYFAAKAMAALLSQTTIGNQGQHCAMYDPNEPGQAATLAHLSVQAADALIVALELA